MFPTDAELREFSAKNPADDDTFRGVALVVFLLFVTPHLFVTGGGHLVLSALQTIVYIAVAISFSDCGSRRAVLVRYVIYRLSWWTVALLMTAWAIVAAIGVKRVAAALLGSLIDDIAKAEGCGERIIE